VHDVVLVGGSTRIPKVQQLLQDFFNETLPSRQRRSRSFSPTKARPMTSSRCMRVRAPGPTTCW
uniref:Heat shock protein 70 n=1 Tax=Aegilops tauschii subsp. strangulata TaxID=200361 RepID=A0A453S0K9_AEGTS